MSVYPPPKAPVKRWDNAPRCGAWMPYAREHCARVAGHAPRRTTATRSGYTADHRTAYALECMRLIRWRGIE